MSPLVRLLLVFCAMVLVATFALTAAQRIGERLRASCEQQHGASAWDRDGYRCVKAGESIEVAP